MSKIKHQQQPTGDTCVSTCIAMVSNKPVAEIVEKYHDDEGGIQTDVVPEILRELGVWSIRYASVWLPWNRVFMVSVPSLNIPGLNHAIVLVTRSETMDIYDPNAGREGALVYGVDCDVKSYSDVLEVFPKDGGAA